MSTIPRSPRNKSYLTVTSFKKIMATLSEPVDCKKFDPETTTFKRYTAMQASNVRTFEITFNTGAHKLTHIYTYTHTHTHIGIV